MCKMEERVLRSLMKEMAVSAKNIIPQSFSKPWPVETFPSLKEWIVRRRPYPPVSSASSPTGMYVYLSRNANPEYVVVDSAEQIPSDTIGALVAITCDGSALLVSVDGFPPMPLVHKTIITSDGHYVHLDDSGDAVYASHPLLEDKQVLKNISIMVRSHASIADLEAIKDVKPSIFLEDDAGCVWMDHGRIIHVIPQGTEAKWREHYRLSVYHRLMSDYPGMSHDMATTLSHHGNVHLKDAGEYLLVVRKNHCDGRHGTIIGIIDPQYVMNGMRCNVGPHSILYTDLNPAWKHVDPKMAKKYINGVLLAWLEGTISDKHSIQSCINLTHVYHGLLFSS